MKQNAPHFFLKNSKYVQLKQMLLEKVLVPKIESNIRNKDFRPALSFVRQARGTPPPWILEWVDWRALVED